jgi:DNA-binding MarR family transcriptional regulator
MMLDEEQYQGLAGFRFALRHFVAASEKLSRDAGITQQQYQAMLAIKTKSNDALSIRDLADQLLLTHHATVQLVDRLAKAGLVERRPSLEDRRSVHVDLTPEGAALLSELAAKHLQEMLRQEPLLRRSLARLKQIGP